MHGSRNSLVDETGKQIQHLKPPVFFERYREVLKMQARRLQKKDNNFVDIQNGFDTSARSSSKLKEVGRSNAVDLFIQKHLFTVFEVEVPDTYQIVICQELCSSGNGILLKKELVGGLLLLRLVFEIQFYYLFFCWGG